MDKARLLASKASHSSDWLYALPITACGLRLSGEAIWIAVGLRLALNMCEPHPCPCGATVTSKGTHGLSCKRSSGRSTRHQQINDAISRALRRADIPSTKEPAGLFRGDEKRPDGLTLVPWQSRHSLTWDVTVVDTLANSYTPTTSVTPCGAVEAAATRKRAKYAEIIQSHHFVPIVIETLGTINMDGQRFLDSLGDRHSSVFSDSRETTFLYQSQYTHSNFQFGCLSWYSPSPSRDSYRRLTPEPVFNFLFNPLDLYYRGCKKTRKPSIEAGIRRNAICYST